MESWANIDTHDRLLVSGKHFNRVKQLTTRIRLIFLSQDNVKEIKMELFLNPFWKLNIPRQRLALLSSETQPGIPLRIKTSCTNSRQSTLLSQINNAPVDSCFLFSRRFCRLFFIFLNFFSLKLNLN